MSMAICNLQAMLDIEDLDQVIKLLEQNNWDEGQAANAYFAQQVAHGPAQNQANNANPFAAEEQKDEHGYRAPIQQQEDQLIDDSPFANLFARPYSAPARNTEHVGSQGGPMGDPFIHQRQRAQTARLPRIQIRPCDYKLQIDTPYDDGEIPADDQIRQRRTWSESIWNLLSSGWATIRWIITLGGQIAPSGQEQLEFGCGEAVLNDDRLLVSIGQNREMKFFKAAAKSRAHKKPMLLLVMGNPDDTQ